MNTLSSSIVCPKCHERFLRKSMDSSPKSGREYFCHHDHEYFGLSDLVNKWNFDVADFYSESMTTQLNEAEWLKVAWLYGEKLHPTKKNTLVEVDFAEQERGLMEFLTAPLEKWSTLLGSAYGMKIEEYVPYSPDTFEGEWSSETARSESYDVVNRMLMGIEELEDGFDARDLPCPILQTGMC